MKHDHEPFRPEPIPVTLVGWTGKVLATGFAGEWIEVVETGFAQTVCLDLPDGSLLLVPCVAPFLSGWSFRAEPK